MKTKQLLCTIALPIAMLCSCYGSTPIKKETPVEKETTGTEKTTSVKDVPKAEPIVLKIAEKVESDNIFAFDLLKTTLKYSEQDNVIISPLCVSFALNMTLNGAAGQTADEMKTALRESKYTIDEINEYSRSMREALLKADTMTTINIASSIWYRNSLSVKEPFIKTNKTYYNAEVNPFDAASDIVRIINDWCDKQTNHKITEIINDSDFSTCLINAIYFKSAWSRMFDKNDTQSDTFYKADGTTEKVDMMDKTDTYSIAAADGCRYLEMDYGNSAFSAVIILPDEGKTIDEAAKNLSADTWNKAISRLTSGKVRVRMPKFKAECSYEMEKKILPAMGMKIPFTEKADFSGMSDSWIIGQVYHKTFIEVNEEGTEAAAVTAVADNAIPAAPVDFYVNKPFIFAIREKSTGVVLFIGKVGKIG